MLITSSCIHHTHHRSHKCIRNSMYVMHRNINNVHLTYITSSGGSKPWKLDWKKRIQAEQPLGAAEPSQGTVCATVCHVAEAKHAPSCGERKVEAQVLLQFGLAAAEGYWAGLVVGPRFTGLGRKRLGYRPIRLDCGSGLGSVQLNRGFWAGLRFGPL